MANKTQSEKASFTFAAIGKFINSESGLVMINEDSDSVSIFLETKEGTSRRTPESDRTGIDTDSLGLTEGTRLTITNAGTEKMAKLLDTGPHQFHQVRDIKVGTRPSYVMVGDFRGNGLLDIVVTNAGSDNISILQNQGDGTFVLGQTLAVGKRPVAIAVGDFFGNGRVDIAVANADSNDISILRNNGSVGFVLGTTISLGSNSPSSLAAGHFLGDGPLDIAVAFEDLKNVTILKNNGQGGLTLTEPCPVTIEARFVATVVDPMNRSGPPDLAVMNGDFEVRALTRNSEKAAGVPLFIESDVKKTSAGAMGCVPPNCTCTGIC